MRYLAEIHPITKVVLQVIVAPSIEWCTQNIPGEVEATLESIDDGAGNLIPNTTFIPTFWVETADPYADDTQTIKYCGPGYVLDETFPEKFAPPWVPPTPDPSTGEWSFYQIGKVVGHEGRLWKSTTENNVWEPGKSAWHPESEIEGILPEWIMPTGGHDVWRMDATVTHLGKRWKSLIPNNATVPGSDPRWWRDLDYIEPIGPELWTQPTGAHNAYAKNKEVTHVNPAFPQITVWRSKINANTTRPGSDGNFHRWWEPIG